MPKPVTAAKAAPTGGQQTPDAYIYIDDDLPPWGPGTKTTLEEADAFFLADAQRLEEALHNSLPGGTYDRLCGLMLARKASHFRVSHAT
jgi:hypothetical protein